MLLLSTASSHSSGKRSVVCCKRVSATKRGFAARLLMLLYTVSGFGTPASRFESACQLAVARGPVAQTRRPFRMHFAITRAIRSS